MTENEASREAGFSNALWKLSDHWKEQADPAVRSAAENDDWLVRFRVVAVVVSVLSTLFFLWWVCIGRFPIVHDPTGHISAQQIRQAEDLLGRIGEQRVLSIDFVNRGEAWVITRSSYIPPKLRKHHMIRMGNRWSIDDDKE